jgi:hypothetical protein
LVSSVKFIPDGRAFGNSFVELDDFGMTQETIQDSTGGGGVSPSNYPNPSSSIRRPYIGAFLPISAGEDFQ